MLYIFLVFCLCFTSCASENPEIESDKTGIDNSKKTDIISVVLTADTSSSELGSFSVSLKFDPKKLRFIKLRKKKIPPINIEYNLVEDKNTIRIIGSNSKDTGILGSIKIAIIYFDNIDRLPYQRLAPFIQLEKDNSYSPMPKQKEIDVDFKIAVYSGNITN